MVVIKMWKTKDADAAWQRLERSKMKCLRPRLPAVDILGVLNPPPLSGNNGRGGWVQKLNRLRKGDELNLFRA